MKKFTLLVVVAMLTVAFASSASAFTWASGLADIYAHGGLDIALPGNDFDPISSIVDPFGGTIGVSPAPVRATVGVSWNTWSGQHSATSTYPYILANWSASPMTLTFDGTVTAFGCYVEPNVYDYFDVTVGLSSGETITKNVYGMAGAEFFGFYDGAVDWIQFSCTDQSGFAVGEMAMAKVPEPGTLLLLGSGLLGLGLIRRRK